MKKLNNYLFQKRAQKYLSETVREHRFVNYNKAKTILLLFESDLQERNSIIRKIISQLQMDGKKVSAWGFVNKKEVESSILPEFRILHNKQTDFSRKPAATFINELANQEFDLLIDLSLKPVLTLEYIAMYAKATLKTGAKKTDLPIFDFVVDLGNTNAMIQNAEAIENPIEDAYLFEQIIFYLKSIQTTD
ncbi:MAG: hypothetical protein P4L34_07495 [Paludibacter sp.]|nr:hypothetical protein [Paludibacter sp.]